MDDRPSFDRELLLPILLGGFSILGILIILLIGRLNAARASVIEVETETPFKYIFLSTEPVLFPESPEASETELLTDIPIDSPTPRSSVATPALGTPDLLTPNTTASPGFPPGNGGGPPGSGTLPASGATPTRTGSSASGPPPLNPGTYDDAHPFLGFSPQWDDQTGVPGAYQGTLHISNQTGSSITFSFIGKELRIFYQEGDGVITITIDSQNFTLDQSDPSNGNEWISDPLPNGTHNVGIKHESGGSVNLDYVIIPEITLTATPTATPTRTPTSTP
jgi:hypothetical protein